LWEDICNDVFNFVTETITQCHLAEELWEPTNTKSSGLAGFCAKSGYFRVT
jgi:hypothetical protein